MKRYFRWNDENCIWVYTTETGVWYNINIESGNKHVNDWPPFGDVTIDTLGKYGNYTEYTEEEAFLLFI